MQTINTRATVGELVREALARKGNVRKQAMRCDESSAFETIVEVVP